MIQENPEIKRGVKGLLLKYQKSFSRNKWDLGRSKSYHHKIVLENEEKLKKMPPYRASYSERSVLNKYIADMCAANIAQPSSSKHSSPLMLLRKPDGSRRPILDMRKVNQAQSSDGFWLPSLEHIIQDVGQSKYVSKLDLRQFYFQIGLTEDSYKYCAFSGPSGGHYELKVIAQGDKNAPPAAQRLIKIILTGLEGVRVLIDDIIIFSETLEKHLEVLEEIFKRLEKEGLKLRADKVEVCPENLVILGYTMKNGRIQPTEENVEKIKNFPRPTCLKELQSFLGLCNFYRKLIRGYADITKPLNNLCKKDSFDNKS